MMIVLLLALLTVSECDSRRIDGRTGQDVTLPCKYDRKHHGALWVCWGRGQIPISGCSNQLISTDGNRVTTRASSRYELLGRLDEGDVSLTIKSLTEGDAGRYGCRVEIPGWFNDDKHHIDLTVFKTPPTETPTEPTANQTAGHMTSTESLLTSPSSTTSSSEEQEGGLLSVLLVCVLLGLVFLLAVGGLLITVRRLKLLDKIPQQLQHISSSVRFSSTPSTLHLHTQSSAVDNIYHIYGDSKGGIYANCP